MAVVIPIETKYNPRGVKVAIRNLDDFKTAVDKAGGGFSGLATVSGKYLQQVGGNIKDVGGSMTRNLTLPIAGLAAASWVAFDQVDSGLDTVAARSGATGKALEGLEGVFRNVAANATQDMGTIGEVVGAVGGKFGLTGTAAERFSNQILDLSRVTGVDAVTATEVVGESLAAFGLKAENAGGFLDTLLTASQKSNVGIDELAKTAAAAAPTFQTYGLGAQESVGLIAAFAGAGLPATRVVGGLNAAFKKFTEQGIKDVPGALEDTLTQIRDMKDGTKATEIAVDLFGSRVGVTLADMVRSGKLSIEDLTASLDGSSGALDRATTAVEGPQEQFARLKNQLMLVGASFMEALLPAIEAIVPYVERAVKWFQGLDDSQKKLIVIIGLVVAAMGPLLMILGSVISVIGGLVAGIGAISLPVIAVIAGIGAFIAILVLLWTKSEAFRNAVRGVWDSIRSAIASVVDAIKKKLEENRDKIETLKNAFKAIGGFIMNTLVPILVKFYGEYLKMVIKTLGFVVGAVIDVIGILVDVGVAIFNGGKKFVEFAREVGSRIGDAIAFVREIPGKVKDALANAATWLVDTGKNMIQGLLDGAGSLLSRIGEFFLDKLPWWIKEPFKKALGISSPSKVFEGYGRNIGEGLIKGSDGQRSKVGEASRRLANAMKKGTKGALQKAIEGATDVRGGLEDRLSKLRDYFDRLRSIVVDAFAELKDRARAEVERLSGVLEDLRSQAQAYGNSIRSAFSVSFSVDDEGKESVLERFRRSIADARRFTEQIRQLRDFGLNETSLQNIIQAGVEQGRQIADSLLSGGSGAIAEVNALQAAFDQQVGALSDLMTQERFGQQIAQAQQALAAAQASFAEIERREREQLAALDALAKRFGVNSDAMELTLEAAQTRIEELLKSEDTATTLLADSVSEVTSGLLSTASEMAAQADRLQRRIDRLTERINAAQEQLNGSGRRADGSRAIGGPVMAGRAYQVGEMGPELFVPSVSGTILTASETRRASGGVTVAPGAVQISVTGGDAAGVQAVVDEAFARLVRELQAL